MLSLVDLLSLESWQNMKRVWKILQMVSAEYSPDVGHWGHTNVALNSLSLNRMYFPLGAKKSSGQSSHSSNTSSGVRWSSSYNPHRLHLLPGSSVRGCNSTQFHYQLTSPKHSPLVNNIMLYKLTPIFIIYSNKPMHYKLKQQMMVVIIQITKDFNIANESVKLVLMLYFTKNFCQWKV